jgi:hypothetical protein
VEANKKDYVEEISKKKAEPLRNHHIKEDYNSMYFNQAKR